MGCHCLLLMVKLVGLKDHPSQWFLKTSVSPEPRGNCFRITDGPLSIDRQPVEQAK